jgi:hypothetical protein
VRDKHGEKALERMAQEHPSQFATNMFKLLPKETEIETDYALEYEPLSATLAWVDEVIGREEDQDVPEPEPGDCANSK